MKNKYFFFLIIIFLIKDQYYQLSYYIIISGVLGNLINRIQYGFVVDFIDVHISSYHFPIFNIADILICIGIIFIIKNNYIIKYKK
ncbi:signal peptidase II [Enterobacteriaceae endosymbiont of Donacia sparganii]|uniref:signal peptidase II n=1 Tax=Enterobacteriaceae endosymbiont of Donacia sparganii TaxID=2675785 RepID=UPI001449DBAE|nr:signal peptidase II [Enterobacteriaceae endosymbiont of Donacia sparganii]QJC35554.1 hypothetical protein GJT98_00300 [Enterobacteriaceae endosymbiont of Donacia sparganii]